MSRSSKQPLLASSSPSSSSSSSRNYYTSSFISIKCFLVFVAFPYLVGYWITSKHLENAHQDKPVKLRNKKSAVLVNDNYNNNNNRRGVHTVDGAEEKERRRRKSLAKIKMDDGISCYEKMLTKLNGDNNSDLSILCSRSLSVDATTCSVVVGFENLSIYVFLEVQK